MSLANQSSRKSISKIIVIDNDDTPSAKDLVDNMADDTGLPCRYVHRPGQNVAQARNAGLDLAETAWIAFIDDDEEAAPEWLEALLQAARTTGATAVFGPVRAWCAEASPRLSGHLALLSAVPRRDRGPLTSGYTGNVLFDRTHPAARDLRFHTEFGRTGGEDADFFDHMHRRGGMLHYAPDALVREWIPAARLSWRWLMVRRFRDGNNLSRIVRANGSAGDVAWLLGEAAAKIAVSLALLPLLAWSGNYWLRCLARVSGKIGIFAYFLGIRRVLWFGRFQEGWRGRSSAGP